MALDNTFFKQFCCTYPLIIYPARNKDSDLEKMLFKIVNMKDYSASEKKKQNNLIKDLNLWNLTVVILDWSFSYSGDVYKLLKSGGKQEFFILSKNVSRSVQIDPPIQFQSIIMEFTPNVHENSPFLSTRIIMLPKYFKNSLKLNEASQQSRQLLEVKDRLKSTQYSETPVSENQNISRVRQQKNNRRWIP